MYKITQRQYQALFKKFEEFYQNETKFCFNKEYLNNLKTTRHKLSKILNIIEFADKNKTTFKSLIKPKKLRSFYRFKRKIKLVLTGFQPLRFLLPISKKNKQIRYIYSENIRQKICNAFFDKNNLHNLTSLWIFFKRKFTKLKKISLTTFVKIIKSDNRYKRIKKNSKIKHPKRQWNLELGNIQMDVKVIGKNDTKINKKIYELDFIDEQSKLVYANIINGQSLHEILNQTKQALTFFSKNKIQVKRIRTDHYMGFKKTNFVTNGLFHKLLLSHNIKHEFIPLHEPQCNGCIERFHKTVDDEFLNRFSNEKDLLKLKEKFNHWINFYNQKRYHFYEVLKGAFDTRFWTPKNFLNKCLKFKKTC